MLERDSNIQILTLDQGWTNSSSGAKYSQPSIVINSFTETHPYLFTYAVSLITLTTAAELSSCYKDFMARKAQSIYSLRLYGKMFANSCCTLILPV